MEYQDNGVWYDDKPRLLKRVKTETHHGFVVEEIPNFLTEASNVQSLLSDRKKFFFESTLPYYHLIMGCLHNAIQEINKNDEKLVFVFAQSETEHEQRIQGMSSIIRYLSARFIDMGHEVVYMTGESIIANNIIVYPEVMHFGISQSLLISNFLSQGLDYSKEPSKKTYLSRGKTTTFNGNRKILMNQADLGDLEFLSKFREEFKYQFTDRIDDEEALENYLRTLGFDIVYPEDFESFEEQLQMIASTKILASITSSSLVGSLVMAKGSTIVEFSTLMGGGRVEEVHVHYKQLSTVNNKAYLSIPQNRSAKDLIDSIEKNNAVKSLLSF